MCHKHATRERLRIPPQILVKCKHRCLPSFQKSPLIFIRPPDRKTVQKHYHVAISLIFGSFREVFKNLVAGKFEAAPSNLHGLSFWDAGGTGRRFKGRSLPKAFLRKNKKGVGGQGTEKGGRQACFFSSRLIWLTPYYPLREQIAQMCEFDWWLQSYFLSDFSSIYLIQLTFFSLTTRKKIFCGWLIFSVVVECNFFVLAHEEIPV